MKTLLQLFIAGLLVANLAACGTKGKLKSPSQIEAAEAKKARKAAEKQPTPTSEEATPATGGTPAAGSGNK